MQRVLDSCKYPLVHHEWESVPTVTCNRREVEQFPARVKRSEVFLRLCVRIQSGGLSREQAWHPERTESEITSMPLSVCSASGSAMRCFAWPFAPHLVSTYRCAV